MSGTEVTVLVAYPHPENLERVRPLFEGDPLEGPLQGGHLELYVLFERALRAQIDGPSSLDVDGLIEALTATEPEALLVEAFFSQVGEELRVTRLRGKKAARGKVVAHARAQSPLLDFFEAMHEGDKERVLDLADRPDFDPNTVLDGVPALLPLMQYGGKKALARAVKRGAELHVRLGPDAQPWGDFAFAPGAGLLAMAVQMKNKSAVRYLLDAGVDVNLADDHGFTALHHAASSPGLYAFVEPLLDAGADVDATTREGLTPLFLALSTGGPRKAVQGALRTAALLIERGANIGHVAADGTSARWLVRGGAPELETFVRAHGVADAGAPEGYYRQARLVDRLIEASRKQDMDSFTDMLDADALDPTAQAELLSSVVQGGHLPFVRRAVEGGVCPRWPVPGGNDMAMDAWARRLKQPEIADYLAGALEGFRREGAARIERAREVYDQFMAELAAVDDQPKGKQEYDRLAAHLSEEALEKYRHSLDHWARVGVPGEGAKIRAAFDPRYDVTFTRPNRFASVFRVKVRTEPRLEVVELRTEPR